MIICSLVLHVLLHLCNVSKPTIVLHSYLRRALANKNLCFREKIRINDAPVCCKRFFSFKPCASFWIFLIKILKSQIFYFKAEEFIDLSNPSSTISTQQNSVPMSTQHSANSEPRLYPDNKQFVSLMKNVNNISNVTDYSESKQMTQSAFRARVKVQSVARRG